MDAAGLLLLAVNPVRHPAAAGAPGVQNGAGISPGGQYTARCGGGAFGALQASHIMRRQQGKAACRSEFKVCVVLFAQHREQASTDGIVVTTLRGAQQQQQQRN